MATGVNVKMGVSGVAQFKQGMKEGQQAVKTTTEALKLNEAQLKLTGDAETYLQNKTALLQRQLQEQERVVNQAKSALEAMQKNGVNPASKEFQAMQQSMLKAQTQMAGMQTELANIGTASEEAQSGVTNMNASLKRIGNGVDIKNVISSIDSITSTMKNAAMVAWRMGEAVVKATLGAGSWADDLVTEATQWEITPEELQRMRKTASLIDTDVDTILGAQQKLRQGLGKESKEALGAFADLVKEGLLPEGYDPRGKNSVDVFWDAGEALMKLNDEYDKQVYAQSLFGKSWRELIPLFSTGRKEYEETMAGWSVVSDDTIEDLGKMDDQYQKLSSEFETFKTELLGAFAGPLTEGMGILTGLFEQLNAYLQTTEGKEMLESLGKAVSGLFEDLSNLDPEEVIAGFTGVFDKIVEGFKWVYDNRQGIVDALKFIIAGWAALKLTGGALEVLQLINGVKGLAGKGAGAAAANGAQATAGAVAGQAAGGWQSHLALPGNAAAAGKAAGMSWGSAFAGAATAAVMLYPTIDKLVNEGVDLSDPFSFMGKSYEETQKKNLDILSDGLSYIYEKAMHPEKAEPITFGQSYRFGANLDEEAIFHRDRRRGTQFQGGDVIEDNRLTNALDKMNATIGETNQTNQMVAQNSLTPADIASFNGLPAQIAAAVQAGVASIQITINAGAVDAMVPRVGKTMWNNVADYIN